MQQLTPERQSFAESVARGGGLLVVSENVRRTRI